MVDLENKRFTRVIEELLDLVLRAQTMTVSTCEKQITRIGHQGRHIALLHKEQ